MLVTRHITRLGIVLAALILIVVLGYIYMVSPKADYNGSYTQSGAPITYCFDKSKKIPVGKFILCANADLSYGADLAPAVLADDSQPSFTHSPVVSQSHSCRRDRTVMTWVPLSLYDVNKENLYIYSGAYLDKKVSNGKVCVAFPRDIEVSIRVLPDSTIRQVICSDTSGGVIQISLDEKTSLYKTGTSYGCRDK